MPCVGQTRGQQQRSASLARWMLGVCEACSCLPACVRNGRTIREEKGREEEQVEDGKGRGGNQNRR